MNNLIIAVLCSYFLIINVFSQSWHRLPVPDTTEDRFEDIFFVNINTGYIINYPGEVLKTTNGGLNWTTTATNLNPALRSIAFFDTNTGLIGTLDSNLILFRTSDAGATWNRMDTAIQGTLPKGICGISIVNTTTAFACGRFFCPPGVIKTTNAGLNWISIPVDTSLARSLIDCYFWSPDSGYVVGGYASNNVYYNGRAVILKTTNGGLNWTRVFYSSRNNEWCWKIQFVNSQLGFTSVERFTNPTTILKTLNGGNTWAEITLPNNILNLEGIGFINEQTGWVGGWGNNFNMPCYETTNGGINWHLAGWGINVNRFRFINDSIAYAVGKSVYKYTREPIGIQLISSEVPKSFILHQNYPNPFNPSTNIRFDIPASENSPVKLIVYDILGNIIEELVNSKLQPGKYEVKWDASKHSSGIYFYTLSNSLHSESVKMILLK